MENHERIKPVTGEETPVHILTLGGQSYLPVSVIYPSGSLHERIDGNVPIVQMATPSVQLLSASDMLAMVQADSQLAALVKKHPVSLSQSPSAEEDFEDISAHVAHVDWCYDVGRVGDLMGGRLLPSISQQTYRLFLQGEIRPPSGAAFRAFRQGDRLELHYAPRDASDIMEMGFNLKGPLRHQQSTTDRPLYLAKPTLSYNLDTSDLKNPT